jgi:hypothetical protein
MTENREAKLTKLRDTLAGVRAEEDQLRADLTTAEEAVERERPQIGAAVRLGEMTRDEADDEYAKLDRAVEEKQVAVEESEAAREVLEERVEAIGDEMAAEVTEKAAAPLRAAQHKVREAEQFLALKQREVQALMPALRAAEGTAAEIVESTRETEWGRKGAMDKRNARVQTVLKAERLARVFGRLDDAKDVIQYLPPRAKAEAEAKLTVAYRQYLHHEREKAGDPSAQYSTP